MALSAAEIATYRRDGLVVPGFRLPSAVLETLDRAYRDLLAHNENRPGFTADFILGPHLASDDDALKTGASNVVGESAPWLEIAQMPEILDMVAAVAGPDLILWGMTIFGKPPDGGKATPWHQDGDYYPIEPLETTTVWISLDHSTPENGCLRYIPGSHAARKVFKHHWEERADQTLAQVIDADQVDLTTARDVVLEPGQVSIHDVYLVHGSEPNISPNRRMGLVLRFMPGTSFYNHTKGSTSNGTASAHGYSDRVLYLMRGQDQTNQNTTREPIVAARQMGSG